MARRVPMAMSQAPGFRGTPDSGHCSSAATSASWANSSARLMSRTICASPAISRGDSILQTASIARWVSAAVVNALSNQSIVARFATSHSSRERNSVEFGDQTNLDLDVADRFGKA